MKTTFAEVSAELIGRSRQERQALVVLSSSAFLLFLMHYVFRSMPVIWHMAQEFFRLMLPIESAQELARGNLRLSSLLWWLVGSTLCYLVIPYLIIRDVLGCRVSEYGLSWRLTRSDFYSYLFCFLPVAALVLLVSFRPDFQAYYPVYKTAPALGFFLLWELLYVFQFFALEFFFRGFLLHGIAARFGSSAIWIMTFPYFMIHFGKPWPEALGAFVAGAVLGFLSLRSGSILPGFFLHISVALWMDICAIWQKGGF